MPAELLVREQKIKLRDHAVNFARGLGLARGTVAVRVSELERVLSTVTDLSRGARDREIRARARNLRRAILAIEYEMRATQSAADRLTRELAADNGVTTS